MNKIRQEVLDSHIDHFKSSVYTSIKFLSPFMEEADITAFITDIISKIYA